MDGPTPWQTVHPDAGGSGSFPFVYSGDNLEVLPVAPGPAAPDWKLLLYAISMRPIGSFLLVLFLPGLSLGQLEQSWFDSTSINSTILIEKREPQARFTRFEFSLLSKVLPEAEQELKKGTVSFSGQEVIVDVEKLSELRIRRLNKELFAELRARSRFDDHGTGFLIYDYRTKGRSLIVVTCKHVLVSPVVYLSFRPDPHFLEVARANEFDFIDVDPSTAWSIEDQRLRLRFETQKLGKPAYFAHPNLDIAAFRIAGLPSLESDGKPLILSEPLAIPLSGMRPRKEIPLGEDVFFIGFPFGVGQNDPICPLLRSGSLAWAPKDSPVFYLDAFSHSGNSGSPVFRKRRGDIASELVGMITSHLVDGDQNAGLAGGVWIDSIFEVLDQMGWKR